MVVPIMLASTTLRSVAGVAGATADGTLKQKPPDAAHSKAGFVGRQMSANAQGLQGDLPLRRREAREEEMPRTLTLTAPLPICGGERCSV
jgi:hypothetical protein